MDARGFLRALFGPTESRSRHLLTLHWSGTASTAVDVDAEGRPRFEHEQVIDMLGALLDERSNGALILRTFENEIATTLPNGVSIPVKTVRGWYLTQGRAHPLSEGRMFAAHCTDAKTGDPIPPERSVVYADAWPVEPD